MTGKTESAQNVAKGWEKKKIQQSLVKDSEDGRKAKLFEYVAYCVQNVQ